MDMKSWEVSSKAWVGPSDAIQGYTRQSQHRSKPAHSKSKNEGSTIKSRLVQLHKENDTTCMIVEVRSDIVTRSEYGTLLSPCFSKVYFSKKSEDPDGKLHHKDVKDQLTTLEKPATSVASHSGSKNKGSTIKSRLVQLHKEIVEVRSDIVTRSEYGTLLSPCFSKAYFSKKSEGPDGKLHHKDVKDQLTTLEKPATSVASHSGSKNKGMRC